MKNYTVKEWMEEWLKMKCTYITPSTYSTYYNMAINHIYPQLGATYLNELSEEKLLEARIYWQKSGKLNGIGGLSPKTVADITTLILSCLKTAQRKGIIQNLPFIIRLSKIPKNKKIQVLTEEQQKKILTVINQEFSFYNLGILLALYTGMRIGEICALKRKDINLDERCIFVSKTLQRVWNADNSGEKKSQVEITSPKTFSAIRIIPINTQLYIYCQKVHFFDPESYLLTGNNKYTEPQTYRRYFYRFLEIHNMPRVSFHTLRHTFATKCMEKCVDYKAISELLGHSSIQTTLNLYVHPQMKQKRQCVELLNYL